MYDIGRPGHDEAAEYYFKYIDLVPDRDIRLILEDQGGETLTFLESIPGSRATHRYAPDKWSIADVLGHVNDGERIFLARAFWFARALDGALPGFDQDIAATNARAFERPWNSLVHEFALLRATTVDFFRHLPDDMWMRRGIASEVPFSVRALAYITAGHVSHHVQIIRERYL